MACSSSAPAFGSSVHWAPVGCKATEHGCSRKGRPEAVSRVGQVLPSMHLKSMQSPGSLFRKRFLAATVDSAKVRRKGRASIVAEAGEEIREQNRRLLAMQKELLAQVGFTSAIGVLTMLRCLSGHAALRDGMLYMLLRRTFAMMLCFPTWRRLRSARSCTPHCSSRWRTLLARSRSTIKRTMGSPSRHRHPPLLLPRHPGPHPVQPPLPHLSLGSPPRLHGALLPRLAAQPRVLSLSLALLPPLPSPPPFNVHPRHRPRHEKRHSLLPQRPRIPLHPWRERM